MRKFQGKGFIAGLLTASILLFSFSGYAESISQTVSAIIDGTKVTLNGKEIKSDTEPLIYAGRTYLPIRAIAEALGVTVNWNDTTKTAELTTDVVPTSTPVPTIKPTPASTPNSQNSRSNPADKSTAVDMTSSLYDGKVYSTQIQIKEIIRGDEAWKKIYDANSYNQKPSDTTEYILAKVYFKLNFFSDKETQFDLDNYDFNLVSGDGKDYNSPSTVLPEPSIDAKLYEGASNEGWIAFIVNKNDTKPLIVYGKDYNGKGGVWFKGYNDIIPATTPTPTIILSATPNPSLNRDTNISSYADLKKYLEDNYSTLNTSKETTSFSFDIYENNTNLQAYDYWIKVKYNSQFFYDLKYNNKWTSEERSKVKQELKNFMEKLGKDVTDRMPTKKLYGGYYDSWYKYPNIQIDLITRRYYSWTNYDEVNYLDIKDATNIYESTKPSSFRWWSFIDDEL